MTKIFILTAIFLTTSCSLAPTFQKPDITTPQSFKEQSAVREDEKILWKPAGTMEGSSKSQWWKIFCDSKLDELETQAIAANQSLKAVAARVDQSRAFAQSVRGGLFPSVDIGGNAVRGKISGASTVAFGGSQNADIKPYTLYSAGGALSYETDFFGKIRDSVKAANLDAEAENALYKNAMLSLQADIAELYFSIRAVDTERKLLRNTVQIRAEAARIMKRRFQEGAAGEQDTSRTQSELASVEADLIALDRTRAIKEHAIAVLLGITPSEFSFAEYPLEKILPPTIPSGLPSTLVERRPDIAAALNRVQASNSRIGVARAAFFPSLTISASGGFESTGLGDLFMWSGRNWALGQTAGNALSLPVFHGGRNVANLNSSKSAYEEAIANYRQQVLLSFRDVEDNLASQRLLAKQSVKQDIAAKTAGTTTAIARKRYNEGETDYFEVVDSERVSLAAKRNAVQILGQRFITAVSLVRALGGGWE